MTCIETSAKALEGLKTLGISYKEVDLPARIKAAIGDIESRKDRGNRIVNAVDDFLYKFPIGEKVYFVRGIDPIVEVTTFDKFRVHTGGGDIIITTGYDDYNLEKFKCFKTQEEADAYAAPLMEEYEKKEEDIKKERYLRDLKERSMKNMSIDSMLKEKMITEEEYNKVK